MITVIWAAILFAVTLITFMIENGIGWHDDAKTIMNTIVPFAFVPVAVVGAIVHTFLTDPGKRTWVKMFISGLLTTIVCVLTLMVVWFLIIGVLDPEFDNVLYRNSVNNYKAMNPDPVQLKQYESTALQTFSPAMIYFINAIVASVSGLITALIAPALMLLFRRKNPAQSA